LGRELHPAFASFNSADPARRRNIPARLAHATIEERVRASPASGIRAKGNSGSSEEGASLSPGNGQTGDPLGR